MNRDPIIDRTEVNSSFIAQNYEFAIVDLSDRQQVVWVPTTNAFGLPNTGKDFSPSVLGEYADGFNLYQYVRSTPVNNLDPRGLYGFWGDWWHYIKPWNNPEKETGFDTCVKVCKWTAGGVGVGAGAAAGGIVIGGAIGGGGGGALLTAETEWYLMRCTLAGKAAADEIIRRNVGR